MKPLTFKEAYQIIPAKGWLTEDEASLLWDTVLGTEGNVLEVGCYYGRSTCLLALACGPKRNIYTVDPFEGFDPDEPTGDLAYQGFLENIRGLGKSHKVLLYDCKIEEWTVRPCGFCYLDGDHSYQGTLNQINKALECKPQSIAVHDVNDSGGGVEVKKACLKLLGNWDKRIERLAVWLNLTHI